MDKKVITLKFDSADARSQRVWKRRLDELCRDLVALGKVSRARAHVVFPGDMDPEMASMFTIDVFPVDAVGLTDALRRMRCLPSVQYAQLAAPRRTFAASRAFGKTLLRAA